MAVIPSRASERGDQELVARLRQTFASDAVAGSGAVTYITGNTASSIEISDKLGSALPK